MANDYEQRLNRVLDHIHDQPAGDLSLDALADVAALSRFHFHRVFHAMTGETVANTVRRMRLHRAATALVQDQAAISAIARSVGYPNLSSFSRAFCEAYRVTPAAFRKRGELRPDLPCSISKGPLMYPVEIRHHPARRLACIAHQGPYITIGRAFEKLGATLAARGLLDQCDKMIGVYHDSPADIPADKLRSHAGFQVLLETPIMPPLIEVMLPETRVAVLTFKGPYGGLASGYTQLFGIWLPGSGQTTADVPMYEIYLNTPMDTAPNDLLTEICLPLGT